MSGTLYICATPIGNLEDITVRALRILKEVDLIAAEDTRVTIKLLNRYEIKNKLTSYHEHNKAAKGESLIAQLKQGLNIALVTDAGVPVISDPGYSLVDACYNENIAVTIIPGPCAIPSALAISGIRAARFTFYGFLPRTKKRKTDMIEKIKNSANAAVIYESPYRITKTLAALAEVMPLRRSACVREMTKYHEEVKRGSLLELAEYYAEHTPKGEFVIVIEEMIINKER